MKSLINDTCPGQPPGRGDSAISELNFAIFRAAKKEAGDIEVV